MPARPSSGRDRRVKRSVLDYLLRAEPALRRHRERVLVAIAVMMTVIAAADVRLWPGISLAFGYSFPVALGAYALGIRMGAALSVLAVVLRAAAFPEGRPHAAWWLYAGSALMLGEYVLLAVGVGLLGRAVARLERQTRVLRHLNELGRNLAAMRDPEAIRRAGVEGAVRLTGADGGFLAAQHGGSWRATAVFRRGQWHDHSVFWVPEPARENPAARQLDAPIQLAARVALPGGVPPCQLVVFRALHGPFTPATAEVLTLAALDMTTALYVAAGATVPRATETPAARLDSAS